MYNISNILFYILIELLIISLTSCFGTSTGTEKIEQKIGGTLICGYSHFVDVRKDFYTVNYKYQLSKDTVIDLGNGAYYEREWNKDEQLIKCDDWLILKTGGWIGTDKIITVNPTTKKTREYEFTPEKIEQDSLWQCLKIKSLLNWCCSESFIDKINDGIIQIHYKFRINQTKTELYDKRELFYRLDNTTGMPILSKIE